MAVATMRTVYDMEAESRRYASHELRVSMLELEAQLNRLDLVRSRELVDGPASARSWISHAEDAIRDALDSLTLARGELRP